MAMSAAPTAGATYLPGAEAAYARGYFQAPPGLPGAMLIPAYTMAGAPDLRAYGLASAMGLPMHAGAVGGGTGRGAISDGASLNENTDALAMELQSRLVMSAPLQEYLQPSGGAAAQAAYFRQAAPAFAYYTQAGAAHQSRMAYAHQQMGAPHYMLDAATVPAGLVAIPVPAAMRTRGGARGAPGSGGGGSGSGHHSERRVQQRKKKVQRGLEENVKRTVYISHIDQQVTEKSLAAFFAECGEVVDCRICGDPNSAMRFAFIEFTEEEGAQKALSRAGMTLGSSQLRVLPSKTAIVPVNKDLMPRSMDEMERCSRTVYVANIDKKVDKAAVRTFFQELCGKVARIRLLGDFAHSTLIAFIEFAQAQGAMAALNCSGAMLGSLPLRVSPSKTPVRGDEDNTG